MRTLFVLAVGLPTHGALSNALADRQQPPATPATAEEARTTAVSPEPRTRFVVELAKPASHQVFALPNPNRVIIDLPDVKVRLPEAPRQGPVGLVRSFRGGISAPGKFRVIIDVTEPVIVERSEVAPGPDGTHQLVVEFIPARSRLNALLRAAASDAPAPAQATAQPLSPATMSRAGLGTIQPPMPRPAERPEKRAARTFKPLIVIDPGHGGHDSGATYNGVVEKDVVLAFSLVLRDLLKASGRYRVEMTRDTDVFVPLDERRAFAESRKAALFIAIHADYALSGARGATIYSLREEVAEELRSSATGEAAEDLLSGREATALRALGGRDAGAVKGILSDLVARETQTTRARTGTFVRSVIEFMGRSTNMNENPDRTAAFRVLQTAKVPAVLIELAFVTNRADAAQLRSDEWRRRVAASIQTAIDNYFSHQSARLPM